MKRILAPILLLTLLFPALAFGETMDDLVKRDGIHYKKFTTVPFTGKVTGKSQGSLKNGKEYGPWVKYWENGQLWIKENYRDGKTHGPRVVYHKNGQLWIKENYRDGKTHGPEVWYFSDGQLHAKGTYQDGKSVGPWVQYHGNGQLLSKGTYKDGKRHGPWVFYDRDGTKRFTKDTLGSLTRNEGSGTYRNGVKVK
jgi:antitoxin component YwqK of YwqJK toxin-antitoxin module